MEGHEALVSGTMNLLIVGNELRFNLTSDLGLPNRFFNLQARINDRLRLCV